MTIEELENILDTYTLEEIIEYNDLSEAEVLYFLIQQEYIDLPEVKPL